jgi:hypothetical protein
MTDLSAGICDQLEDKGFGYARCGSRIVPIEAGDPRIDVGGLQRGDESNWHVPALFMLHDEPHGGRDRDDAKRQRRAGKRNRKDAGTVERSLQHKLERREGRLAFRKQDQLMRRCVLPCQLSGNAAQDLIGTGIADGNG